jgi:hypothetical protein
VRGRRVGGQRWKQGEAPRVTKGQGVVGGVVRV